VAVKRFNASDVVRHPLVGRIIQAYDAAPKPEADAYKTKADQG
jgi:phosphate starvation-inducible protein PhoH